MTIRNMQGIRFGNNIFSKTGRIRQNHIIIIQIKLLNRQHHQRWKNPMMFLGERYFL